MRKDKRILVVDDEARFRKTLSKILESCGYEVTMAASGPDALALFEQRPFPLLITDIQMPGMSGIELLKAVKSISPESEVVVTNSYAYLGKAISAMRAGAFDCLIKPFRDQEVIGNTAHQAMEKVRLQVQNQSLIQALKQHNKALEAANARLKQMATHDGLTGLFNHRHLQDNLVSEINRSRRYRKSFSILFIDLDDFKIYNDRNGHLAGDALLKTLSALFTQSFRKTDLVARYGGDEFVVILPETDHEQARQIAQKLRCNVSRHHFRKSDVLPNKHVSVSIGTASYPEHGSTSNDLLHHADQALYRDKEKKYQHAG